MSGRSSGRSTDSPTHLPGGLTRSAGTLTPAERALAERSILPALGS